MGKQLNLSLAICFILLQLTYQCVGTDNILKISHKGLFVAQFNIVWEEPKNGDMNHVSEDNTVKQGSQENEYVEKGWEKNWKDLTAPFSAQLRFGPNARNLTIYARECTGLAWEWWRTVIDLKNVPVVPFRECTISGTTLNPSWECNPSV